MNPDAITNLQDLKDMLSVFTIGINVDTAHPEMGMEALQKLEDAVSKNLVIKTKVGKTQ